MCVLTKDGTTEMECVGVWDVLGMRSLWGCVWYERDEKGRHPHIGILTNEVVHVPTVIVEG